MAFDKAVVPRLCDFFANNPEITEKRMFGGNFAEVVVLGSVPADGDDGDIGLLFVSARQVDSGNDLVDRVQRTGEQPGLLPGDDGTGVAGEAVAVGEYCVVVADTAVIALQFSGKGLTAVREVVFELLPLRGQRESTSGPSSSMTCICHFLTQASSSLTLKRRIHNLLDVAQRMPVPAEMTSSAAPIQEILIKTITGSVRSFLMLA